MAVSKRLRMEILRRDNHTCRYCGGTAPEVRLTIDHVVPITLGGQDAPENLVAACVDCNAGKSSIPGDSQTVADVAADAMRWRRAMEVAQEMGERDQAARDAFCAEFWDHWHTYTYSGGMQIVDGKAVERRLHVALPPDWHHPVGELMAAGLSARDMWDAIDITMGARCKDEFRYFLGVARNKIGVKQQVAQELIRRGLV